MAIRILLAIIEMYAGIESIQAIDMLEKIDHNDEHCIEYNLTTKKINDCKCVIYTDSLSIDTVCVQIKSMED